MKIFITCLFSFFSLLLLGQNRPQWISDYWREATYPTATYYSSFLSESVNSKETADQAKRRMEGEVKRKLSESIRVQVKASENLLEQTYANDKNSNYQFSHYSEIQTSSDAEIVNMTVSSFHSQKENKVYAFAYVGKQELIDYYTANIALQVQQIEGLIKTARELEVKQEFSLAKKKFNSIAPMFADVMYMQNLLIAVSQNVDNKNLQYEKCIAFQNELTQAMARLNQSFLIYVDSQEELFDERPKVIANKVKGGLSEKGFSFTDDKNKANIHLFLSAKTREYGEQYGVVCCYADVQIKVVDALKKKSIYQDEFSQKGLAMTAKEAGRKAFDEIPNIVMEKISDYLE